ncbi:undecaprenyl-diphosphate phosphatase [Nodosilinea sp. P-1105]|uniref:undecaprenyl-diphosphate phosphatase n=1 Tax=Nodosilinea sp. P-1105 TaxID=2546229 RepID=UPI00146E1BEA|nr:undecaprenyl-diphosphate phosphatase [Nodosilinea sp. P-1105]NMF83147.1 undecaprenyl-diphosphate phosphatase [Nodosilinea sp. P-1105]
MSLWQAIVIGVVQGFTEFLPISSTAHVKIVPVLLGWGDPGVAFTAVIQLGSIAAILWYFWDDLVQVTTGMVKAVRDRDYDAPDFRLGLGILLGTLPLIIGGIFVKVFIPDFDNSFLRSSATIAIVSIVMAGLLGVAEMVGSRIRNFESLKMHDGITMGLGQALAIIPGVSRAGATLTAGLFMGLERSTAARFSFLMGIPAITLAGVVEFKDFFDAGTETIGWLPLSVGLIATVISSYLSIVWLIGFLKRHTTWVFVWYRLAFGVVILTAIAMGHTPNL